MDDEDYKPRSPDLSALTSYTTGAQQYQQSSYSPSYTYPSQQPFSLPESSSYQPHPTLQRQSSSAYSQTTAYVPPTIPSNGPPLIKTDEADLDLNSRKASTVAQTPQTPVVAGKARKMSTKQQQHALAQGLPRLPAPGDDDHIVIKTKFPVARIKRLVQADEEVGKVAQVTPPVVGKALELFMIQITLAAVAEAQARGSKRLTASHIKAAISADEKFDFLKEIGDKIPDGPAPKGEAKERRPKAEKVVSDEDMDGEHSKAPAKRRSVGKRRKVSDDDE